MEKENPEYLDKPGCGRISGKVNGKRLIKRKNFNEDGRWKDI